MKISFLLFFVIFFTFNFYAHAQAPVTSCDDHAEFHDPNKVTKGVTWSNLNAEQAINDCNESLSKYPNELRFMYQLARGYYKNDEYEKAYNLLITFSVFIVCKI